MAPEQFYFINAKFRITEIHHFFISLILEEENSHLWRSAVIFYLMKSTHASFISTKFLTL